MWRSLINIQLVSRFKTVNGKEACTTVVSDTQSRSLRRFKTVNGKEACTTIGNILISCKVDAEFQNRKR